MTFFLLLFFYQRIPTSYAHWAPLCLRKKHKFHGYCVDTRLITQNDGDGDNVLAFKCWTRERQSGVAGNSKSIILHHHNEKHTISRYTVITTEIKEKNVLVYSLNHKTYHKLWYAGIRNPNGYWCIVVWRFVVVFMVYHLSRTTYVYCRKNPWFLFKYKITVVPNILGRTFQNVISFK